MTRLDFQIQTGKQVTEKQLDVLVVDQLPESKTTV